MSGPAPIAPVPEDRHGRILAELAGLSLELSRDLQARALAAETVEDATRLAAAFHRTARAVRQCLALEARLVHDRAREARARTETRLKLDDHRRRWTPSGPAAPARPEREWERLHDDLDAFETFDDDLDELLVPPDLRRPSDTPPPAPPAPRPPAPPPMPSAAWPRGQGPSPAAGPTAPPPPPPPNSS